MFLSTAALAASFLLATMAPLPAQAELVLPSLGKNDKNLQHHDFETTISFKTKNDLACTSEEIAMIEEAFILSCNESHDPDQYHGESMKIEEASHGPAIQIVGGNSLGGFRKRYYAWYKGSFGAGCNMCGDDDDRLMDNMLAAAKGGPVKEWEETLCFLLTRYRAFDGIDSCKIDVKYKKGDAAWDMGE